MSVQTDDFTIHNRGVGLQFMPDGVTQSRKALELIITAGNQLSGAIAEICKVRNPSYLSSKNQSGWSNGAARRARGIGENLGSWRATAPIICGCPSLQSGAAAAGEKRKWRGTTPSPLRHFPFVRGGPRCYREPRLGVGRAYPSPLVSHDESPTLNAGTLSPSCKKLFGCPKILPNFCPTARRGAESVPVQEQQQSRLLSLIARLLPECQRLIALLVRACNCFRHKRTISQTRPTYAGYKSKC